MLELKEYIKLIERFDVVALAGKIIYTCEKDKRFEMYLNHIKRGGNQFKNGELINFNYLLFGNCIILTSVLKNLGLNLSLKKYGGEELDFSYRLNKQQPNKIRYCKLAVAKRCLHPNLHEHLNRLYEFGFTNFNHLDNRLQKKIVRNSLFLKKNVFLKWFVFPTYYFLYIFKKVNIFHFGDYYIFRALMFFSIIRGYFSSK